jgi:phenylacetate-coenzyme A ligase PaaK-like adenylate-forming protein
MTKPAAEHLPPIDFSRPVYGVPAAEKQLWLEQRLLSLACHHYHHCPPYQRFIDAHGVQCMESLASLPPVMAGLFKTSLLQSVDDDAVFKVLLSSGTGSEGLSRIVLDRDTAMLQSKALGKILQTLLGHQRQPMLLVDHNGLLANRQQFNARGAGVQGIALFGREQTYVLNADMALDLAALDAFYQRYAQQPVLMFGFTFMVWAKLFDQLEKQGRRYDFSQLTLLHSGGWKKLQDRAVSQNVFDQRAQYLLGDKTAVHNFYGMVEQTGSIYLACEHGRLHAPLYADIRIRNPRTFECVEPGQSGLIETLSVLPQSYPGHALLTQDLGRVTGEDDCPCGRLGKTLQVFGRQASAELRGCSDSYELG